MNIYPITYSDLADWLEMSLDLWPEESREDMRGFLESFIEEKKYHNFIARNARGDAMGFINLSIRSDYVEGSSGSPVVFIPCWHTGSREWHATSYRQERSGAGNRAALKWLPMPMLITQPVALSIPVQDLQKPRQLWFL